MKVLKIKKIIFWHSVGLFIIVFLLFQSDNTTLAQQNRQLERDKPITQNEKRIALVIGNSSYADSPLRNPVNDASDMASALKTLGFEVSLITDSNQADMKRAIRNFGERLRNNKGIGLFYYAGHGVQVKGVNYLVPIGTTINTEEEVEYEGVDVGLVLAQMESAKNKLNIVILDACRNNPFARSFRSAEKGLASIDAPSGTLLAYSTAPGSVASDGTGRNGLYTQELLKQIRTSGLGIEDIFKRVRVSVRSQTQEKQTPWESSSLTGDFYFIGKASGESKPNTSEGTSVPESLPVSNPVDAFLAEFAVAVGSEKSKEIKTLVLKGTVEVEYNGQKGTGQKELYLSNPGKSLDITKYSNGFVSKQVYNGDQGWIHDAKAGTKEAPIQQIELNKRSNAATYGDITAMKNLYTKITLKGVEKLDNKEVFVLEVTPKDNKSERIYFDTSSKLIYRWDFSLQSSSVQQGITFAVQIYYEDYVDINGFQVPMTIRQKDSKSTIITKFDLTQLKYNVPLDNKLFAKP